jgi:hypothetical protein
MNIGDRVVVSSPWSSFYRRRGTIERINFINEKGRRTPLGYYVLIDDYGDRRGSTPFMENEISPSTTAYPSGSAMDPRQEMTKP